MWVGRYLSRGVCWRERGREVVQGGCVKETGDECAQLGGWVGGPAGGRGGRQGRGRGVVVLPRLCGRSKSSTARAGPGTPAGRDKTTRASAVTACAQSSPPRGPFSTPGNVYFGSPWARRFLLWRSGHALEKTHTRVTTNAVPPAAHRCGALDTKERHHSILTHAGQIHVQGDIMCCITAAEWLGGEKKAAPTWRRDLRVHCPCLFLSLSYTTTKSPPRSGGGKMATRTPHPHANVHNWHYETQLWSRGLNTCGSSNEHMQRAIRFGWHSRPPVPVH